MTKLSMDPKTGEDVEAIDALRSELGTTVASLPGGFASFPSLRINGPAGEILVAASRGADGVVFLAQRVGSYAELSDLLGASEQIEAVAGIVRKSRRRAQSVARLGLRSPY